MNLLIPLLILGLTTFPLWAEASQTPRGPTVKSKQTIVIVNKPLTYKQTQSVKKAIKGKKCRKGVDPKSKQVYYVCN